MNIFLGEISVPLTYGEINSLIISQSEYLSNYVKHHSEPKYIQQQLDRLNFLVSMLRKFEEQAEQNNG